MSESSPDPAERFSNRVADYVRYRPSYPPSLFETLRDDFGLAAEQTAADVGSGTGIFSKLLLDEGLTVLGVEPNDAMRRAAEETLGAHPHFQSIAAGAEATTLSASSVDWIFAAQAFHWFDLKRCRTEFERILRPGGRVVLVWNNRRHDTPFLADYEQILLQYGTDYAKVRHDSAETRDRIAALYAPYPVKLRTFDNEQHFDKSALRGRTFSSSYTPPPINPDHPGYDVLDTAVGELFDRHQNGGEVVMLYETRMYVGKIA